MTDHERAIASIEKSLDASAALRRHLVATERTGRKMIAALQRGVPISEAVVSAGGSPSELRRSTTEMLADYEHARHQMRTAFLLPTLAEGKSIGDIGRELGISRQLASRLVREARGSSSPVGR
jgi:hypothetical protein